MLSNNWLKALRNRLASGSCLPQRRRRGKTGTKVQPLEQRSLLAATILFDDFESGAMNVAKWDYVDAYVSSSGPVGQSGTYAAGLDGLDEEFN